MPLKKHNDFHFEHYKEMLDVFHKTAIAIELESEDICKVKNVGFRLIYLEEYVYITQSKIKETRRLPGSKIYKGCLGLMK